MKRKRYAVYARNSTPLVEGSLTKCLRFLRACMPQYETLTLVERADA